MPRRCAAARRPFVGPPAHGPHEGVAEGRRRRPSGHASPCRARARRRRRSPCRARPPTSVTTGKRPVAHRLHLGEAARLEAARHHEQVAAGEHQVRERLVVALDEDERRRDARRRRRAAPGRAPRRPSRGSPAAAGSARAAGTSGTSRSMPFWSASRVTDDDERAGSLGRGRAARSRAARASGLARRRRPRRTAPGDADRAPDPSRPCRSR